MKKIRHYPIMASAHIISAIVAIMLLVTCVSCVVKTIKSHINPPTTNPYEVVTSIPNTISIDEQNNVKALDAEYREFVLAEVSQPITPDPNTTYPVAPCQDYKGYITEYMDLHNRMTITTDDIQKCIDYFTADYPMSVFKISAHSFIEASKVTGYDPIFLLALAGVESGWNASALHRNLCNPYSIGMWDGIEEENGSKLGESWCEGIVVGAEIIDDLWYQNGQTCLASMQQDHIYATDTEWTNKIVSVMNTCYNIITAEE